VIKFGRRKLGEGLTKNVDQKRPSVGPTPDLIRDLNRRCALQQVNGLRQLELEGTSM